MYARRGIKKQRGRSWAMRGCRYRVGPGRSRRVSLGGSSQSQAAGPGKSVSIRSVVRDLMAETLSPSWWGIWWQKPSSPSWWGIWWQIPQVHRGEGSDGRKPSPHGCWTLFYPSFSPAYMTSLCAWARVMCVPPEMAIFLEISPHKRPFPSHYQQLIPLLLPLALSICAP